MIHPGLGFVDTGLSVAYRASDRPQIVNIDLTYAQSPLHALGPLAFQFLVEAINWGAAAGSEFSPLDGACQVVGEQAGVVLADGRVRWSWQIEATAMAPLFLKAIVERLSWPDDGAAVTALDIRGALPLDSSPLSASDHDVRTWLDDTQAYLGGQRPPFPVVEQRIQHGAALRMTVGSADQALLQRFLRLVGIWIQACYTVVNCTEEYIGVTDVTASVFRNGSELCARFDAFDFDRAPLEDTLLNMLTRFHHQVTPIARLDLALPG